MRPWTVCSVLALSSFVAGFGVGIATGVWLWLRYQSSGTLGRPKAKVLHPPPSIEERASSMESDQAVEEGTREILRMAKDMGITMTYEEAREEALAAVGAVFPDSAPPAI